MTPATPLVDRIALALAADIAAGRDHGCLHEESTAEHTIVVHGWLDLRALAQAAAKAYAEPRKKTEDQVFPIAWGLTRTEDRVLSALALSDCASKDAILASVYAHRSSPCVTSRVVDVYICKLRKKLKPLGFEIQTIFGKGWGFSAEHREALAKVARSA